VDLILPAEAHEAIVRHLVSELPNEGCGLLAGPKPGEVRMVYPLGNVRRSRTSFTVDPTGHFRAMQHAERRGWQVNGVFHSHPASAPEPSPTDVRLAHEPEWVHVLVGLSDPAKPEMRAFRIVDDAVFEVPVRRPRGEDGGS
jgi:proteasome lid subunit RPN8/RPN11